jgi:hypothetical protein
MRSKKGSLAEIQNQLVHQSIFSPIVLNRRRSQDCSKLLTNEGNGNDILRLLGACNFPIKAAISPIKADLAARLIEAP